MTDTIHKSAIFSAPPELVWDYLTDKEKLGTWFHPARENLEEGKDYELLCLTDDGVRVPQIWGKVLNADRPRRLVYTFIINPFEGRETTVTWTLEAVAGGTRLSLSHSGVSDAVGDNALNILMALDKGWDEHLRNMREAINT